MKAYKIALIGNPNCGKSTLFNALTGSHQRVGNWPGVTIERKSGYFGEAGHRIEVVDLPGIYSLVTPAKDSALDARIACEAINGHDFNLLINIVDASNLERHLYLTTQLLDMNVPMVVVVNMLDVVERQGVQINLSVLRAKLGCPVVGISATRQNGIAQLKNTIVSTVASLTQGDKDIFRSCHTGKDACVSACESVFSACGSIEKDALVPYPKILQQSINIMMEISGASHQAILRWLEGNQDSYIDQLPAEKIVLLQQQQHRLQQKLGQEIDLFIAHFRYTAAHQLAEAGMQKTLQLKTSTLTQHIDKVVLSRIWGIPLFLVSMYVMFFFSINIGGAFQPFFESLSNAIFVRGFAQLLQNLHVPDAVNALLTVGVGQGISTVLTFVPVIGCLFLWLSFLEGSGYMARAAFVIDRIMRAMGLPGKSFVPLIVGFGCNVPAIMATRTLDHRRDRLLTMMMSPFMSCGARLAIYAVFTAAFFPTSGQNIIFALYLLGIFIAVMTGFLLRKTVLQGESSSWLVELPSYHFPSMSVLLRATWQRLKGFIVNAGRFIIPVCFLVGVLNAFTVDGKLASDPAQGSPDSVLAIMGKAITPVFAPMGISTENWPATVGLLTGVLAKEVVVGTLNTLYTQISHLPVMPNAEEPFHFVPALQAAVMTIPEALSGLKDGWRNPIAASGGDGQVSDSALGMMVRYFDGQAGAMAYLLFVLLYFPCVSATAALARESTKRWALFSVLWTTGLAYVVAVIFYQLATWTRHPLYSSSWIAGLSIALAIVVIFIKKYADRNNIAYA